MTGVESCMYYEISDVFAKYDCRRDAEKFIFPGVRIIKIKLTAANMRWLKDVTLKDL